MLLLLLPGSAARPASATTAARLAMRHGIAALTAAKRLIAGGAVARGELDFQLNDFVPLLIGPIPLGDRKKFAQTTTGIERLSYSC